MGARTSSTAARGGSWRRPDPLGASLPTSIRTNGYMVQVVIPKRDWDGGEAGVYRGQVHARLQVHRPCRRVQRVQKVLQVPLPHAVHWTGSFGEAAPRDPVLQSSMPQVRAGQRKEHPHQAGVGAVLGGTPPPRLPLPWPLKRFSFCYFAV
jgi:hypothetical protein